MLNPHLVTVFSDKLKQPLFGLLSYAVSFQTLVGTRMYLILVLTLLATLFEGVGVVMLIPLFENLSAGGGVTPHSTTGFKLLDVVGSIPATVVFCLIGGVFVVKGFVTFAASYYSAHLGARLVRELKSRLLDGYSRISYVYYAQRGTGYFTNIIGQVEGLRSAFESFVGLLARGVMAAGLLGIAFVVAWRFGLMALVIGFVVLTLFKGLNSFVRDLSRKVIEEEGHLAGLLIEALQAYKYLVATGHFAQLQKGADESIARLTTLQLKSSVASAFATAVREPLVVFLIVLLVLVQIGLLNQSLAPIIVSIVLFHRGLNAILNLQPYWMGLHGSIGAVEAIRDELSAQGRHREPDGIRNVGPLKQSIEFRHVSFFYEPSLGNALDDVSLIIPAFSTVAIVGASGAGKSTLIDMLSLLIKPCSGDVIIDGTRGAEIKLDTWRQQIGYVPQDPVVFDDSVANNICLWQGDPTTDAALLSRVRDAAQQSRLHDFVASLPQAYDTQLGDRGIRLSGGERQRLAIARELFRKPSLLILDEATSALDTQTELYIRESIRALRGRMTIVMVAHRLSTVRDADHVYVFENGRCIEDGSYKALQTRDGSRLREMIALQAL